MDYLNDNYRRFLNGEDDGLTLIIKEYKDGLILYINNYVNNIYIAEDLMQETFVKIAVKKPEFKGKSSFKTWLYAIGRNTTLDYLRHNSKYKISLINDTSLTFIQNSVTISIFCSNLFIKTHTIYSLACFLYSYYMLELRIVQW